MTNHDLARAAADKCKAYKSDDWAAVIRDTYAAPMAELERLKRQVELCRKHGPVRSVPGHPTRLACTLCGKWNPVKPRWLPKPVHHPDCPHNEVAT